MEPTAIPHVNNNQDHQKVIEIFIDGNDGTGKTSLVKQLREAAANDKLPKANNILRYEFKDRSILTAYTDIFPTSLPKELPTHEIKQGILHEYHYFLLDATVKESLRRILVRGEKQDEFDKKDKVFLYRNRYRRLAIHFKIPIIDTTSQSKERVYQMVHDYICSFPHASSKNLYKLPHPNEYTMDQFTQLPCVSQSNDKLRILNNQYHLLHYESPLHKYWMDILDLECIPTTFIYFGKEFILCEALHNEDLPPLTVWVKRFFMGEDTTHFASIPQRMSRFGEPMVDSDTFAYNEPCVSFVYEKTNKEMGSDLANQFINVSAASKLALRTYQALQHHTHQMGITSLKNIGFHINTNGTLLCSPIIFDENSFDFSNTTKWSTLTECSRNYCNTLYCKTGIEAFLSRMDTAAVREWYGMVQEVYRASMATKQRIMTVTMETYFPIDLLKPCLKEMVGKFYHWQHYQIIEQYPEGNAATKVMITVNPKEKSIKFVFGIQGQNFLVDVKSNTLASYFFFPIPMNGDKSTTDKAGMLHHLQELQLLFITPESILNTARWPTLHQKLKECVKLFVFDEAHCIIADTDYRPDFGKLGKIQEEFPSTPKLIMTATATEKTRKEICDSLKIEQVTEIFLPVNRPNIAYSVQHFARNAYKNKLASLDTFLKQHKDQCGIVFCHKVETVELVKKYLNKSVSDIAKCHHSKVKDKNDSTALEWKKNKFPIVVATSGFGTGIDKVDVRFVIHFDIPESMNSYHQESGRAGRDGKPAESVIFYDNSAKCTREKAIKKSKDQNKTSKLAEVKQIEKFCLSSTCRRKMVLKYFEDSAECNHCCDVCTDRDNVANTIESFLQNGFIACIACGQKKPIEMEKTTKDDCYFCECSKKEGREYGRTKYLLSSITLCRKCNNNCAHISNNGKYEICARKTCGNFHDLNK